MKKQQNLPRNEKVEIVSLKGSEKANLKYSILDGAFATAATKIVDSYSIPFIFSMGASKVEVAMLDSLQSLARGISQLPGVKLTEKLRSRKLLWNICSALQRLMLLPIIFMLFSGINIVILAIAFFALSTFFMALKSPAWTSLMGDIVPENMRGKFFARRNMLMGLTSLVAILAIGSMISSFGMQGNMLQGYALAFIISLVLGLFSVMLVFLRIEEPPYMPRYNYASPFKLDFSEAGRWLSVNRNYASFTAFIALMQFSVRIASPFIAVYILSELQFGIAWLAAIMALTTFSETLSYRHWGKAVDIFGERTILAVTGILVILIPISWLFASIPAHGLLIAILDGFAWSGFDTAAFAFNLSSMSREKRLSYVGKHNTIKEFSMFAGASAGGILSHFFDSSPMLALTTIQSLFLASFILRAASLSLLPAIKNARSSSMSLPVRKAFVELVARQPFEGTMGTILLPVKYTRKGYQSASESIRRVRRKVKELLYRIKYLRLGAY
ncbi:MAG: MFS transporter [Candidatus Aenigmarchaeota archaeon]|nr:MFS transporter [Candidatus Aenigmarchaeota archaeon]